MRTVRTPTRLVTGGASPPPVALGTYAGEELPRGLGGARGVELAVEEAIPVRKRQDVRRDEAGYAGRRQGPCRDECVEHEGRAPVARFERLEHTRSRRRGRDARRRLCVAALRSALALAERSPPRRPWHDPVTPRRRPPPCRSSRRPRVDADHAHAQRDRLRFRGRRTSISNRQVSDNQHDRTRDVRQSVNGAISVVAKGRRGRPRSRRMRRTSTGRTSTTARSTAYQSEISDCRIGRRRWISPARRRPARGRPVRRLRRAGKDAAHRRTRRALRR